MGKGPKGLEGWGWRAGWLGEEGSRKHGGRVKKFDFPFQKKRGGEGVTPGSYISHNFFISVPFPISLGTSIYDNIFYIILLPIVYILIPLYIPYIGGREKS